MPLVPMQPQVDPRPMPGARQNFDVNATMFGAGVAAAGGRLGQTLNDVADQIDSVKVTNAQIEAMKQLNDAQGQAYALQGVNAAGAAPLFEKNASELRAKLLADLTPRQAQLFSQRYDPMAISALEGVQRHSQGQLRQADVTGQQSRVGLGIDSYGQTVGDAKQMATYRKEVVDGVGQLAKLQGMAPETYALVLKDSLSKMHIGAVQRLQTEGRNGEAVAYLNDKAHLDEIDPNFRSQLLRQSQTDLAVTDAQGKVQALEQQYGTDYAKMRDVIWNAKDLDGVQKDRVQHYINVREQDASKARQQADLTGLDNYNQDLRDQKNPLVMTYDAMTKRGYPTSLIEHILNAQVSQRAKADVAQQAKDSAPALFDQIANYDPKTDAAQEQRKTISMKLADLRNLDPDQATPLSKMFYEKVVEGRKLDPATRELLYDPKNGLLKRIQTDVAEASDNFGPFTGGQLTKDERYTYSLSLWQQVIDASKKHPDWTPVELNEFYDNNPQMKQLREHSLLKKNYERFTKPSAPSFTPAAITVQPIILNLSADDAKTLEAIRQPIGK
ncbi:MAG: hypothetical protein WCS70_09065 [Verrucomicrobiota bacterium]